MRTFDFPVDRAHARSVNETLGDVRRLRISSVVFAVLLAGGAAWLYVLDHAWSYILCAVLAVAALMSLWVSVWAPRKVGSIDELYASSALVPAMVSETRPRGATILALIDIAKPETTVPHYALVVRNVRALPGHTMTEGERVPSVAVLSDRSARSISETWQMVSPMPVAWGTRDRTVLRTAIEAIDPVEWKLLRKNLSVSETVRQAENDQLLIDPHDLPEELLQKRAD
ncbi:DUF3239 domain-containing protein [Rhodococcus sp. UNC23MFCrub1.1]|uniref:DUF3239 domain-containing protein n=1 Tax=Rhodococcus sp. UNC23MFCrub1.1 TaxID=1449068 RepID=UPI000489B104|nr:DUF3239 domain-containing protein [Rhodococcus sp. UNC23MFCrub1.1]